MRNRWLISDMVFIWILLYGFISSVANVVPGTSWIRSLLLTGYALVFLYWIWKTGRQKQISLGGVNCRGWKDGWHLLPLLLFPAHNMIFASGSIPPVEVWLEMLSICLVEELLFRGFLLSWLRKRGVLLAILGTSLAFSVLHLVNFISVGDARYVLMQVVSSFFVSVCYCGVTIGCGSLLPCAAAHFLTNILGMGEISFLPGLLCCIVLHGVWGSIMCFKVYRKEAK